MAAIASRHVVLFRAAKGPDDAYKQVLERAGFYVHFVKALRFEYNNAENLISALQLQHGGVILTSQTAVESIIHAVSLAKGDLVDILKWWENVPVFVVGKATAAAVRKLGLKTTGSACGNAELLAEEIVKYFSNQEKSIIPPLLFPCGNLAREAMPQVLKGAGLRVHIVVCYNTTRDPAIEHSLTILNQQGVLSGQCWVVFFSPSGVQFSLPLLKAYCDMKTLKVAAIGPTTAEALQSTGLCPVISHTPSPEALLDAMQ